jgi:AraC-like DNA-binding protein
VANVLFETQSTLLRDKSLEFVFQERPSDAPLVERVWQTQSQRAGSFISVAAIQWEMVVMKYQGQATLTVRGPATKATPADFPAGAEFFGIVFELGTFMPQLPTIQRLDRNDLILPEATRETFWLNNSTWQIPDYDNADTFVNQLVRDGLLVRDPVVDAVLQDAPPPLSIRSLQYRFLRATGLTHKVIQQIERARRARLLLTQGTPILDTVSEAGYFDQAHLTNSLKRYMGQTPAQITRVRRPD